MTTIARAQFAKLSIVALISLTIASAWLLFPYLVPGKDLMRGVGSKARLIKGGNVSLYQTRYLVENANLELMATFATDEFFQYVDRSAVVGNVRPDRNFIFYVSENIHEGQLSFDLPEVSLHMGDEVYTPAVSSGPNLAEHHCITLYSFPKRDAAGEFIDINLYDNIRLHVSNRYLGSEQKLNFVGVWEAPYELPEELASRADITPVAMMALGAGLLSSVLTNIIPAATYPDPNAHHNNQYTRYDGNAAAVFRKHQLSVVTHCANNGASQCIQQRKPGHEGQCNQHDLFADDRAKLGRLNTC